MSLHDLIRPHPGLVLCLLIAPGLVLAEADTSNTSLMCLAPDTETSGPTEDTQPPGLSQNSTSPAPWLRPATVTRRPDLYSPPDALPPGARLADIRHPDAYTRLRIPGSLNLRPHTLKTKHHLRDTPLVLTAEGHSYTTLEALAADLTTAGFQVSILDGGLHRWRHEVGPLQGDPLAHRDLDTISPRDYFIERQFAHWLPVYLGDPDDSPVDTVIPTIDATLPARLQAISEGFQAERQLDPFLLLITPDGNQDRARAFMRRSELLKVFYLEGGLAGFEGFIRDQIAMARRIPLSERRRVCGS